MMNDAGADLVLRIHANGGGRAQEGAMMLVPDGHMPEDVEKESISAGEIIFDAYLEETGADNLGVIPRSDMTGFNWSTVSVCLIEMGFMTNPAEDELMSTDKYQDKIVKGLANGIENWHGMKEEESMPAASAKKEDIPVEHEANLPDGFVYVRDIDPGIRVDLQYASVHNFTGDVVDGYYSTGAAILTEDTAKALSRVQDYLNEKGYGLLVYDAYRPIKAVELFVKWVQNDDTDTKEDYYPELEKAKLLELGYIARRSTHSKGNTVDLTVVDADTGELLDMGGHFDFFGDISHTDASSLTNEQKKNRELLRDAMLKYGFSPYSKEWWHFSLDSAGGDRYNFDVK
jgi:D-alanyl-D-alanine dipeptidase